MPTTPTTELPRLLTADELADATGLRLHRIYELARMDEIPHVRVGRSVRFPADAVRDWIASGGTANGNGAEG